MIRDYHMTIKGLGKWSRKVRNLFTLMGLLCLLGFHTVLAEGTKQWSPTSTDRSHLKVNTAGVYAFAGYGVVADRRLYIHIENPANERVYIGLSTMVDENSAANVATAYSFRIASPTGAVVHGPYTVNGGVIPNLTTYAMSVAGPAPIAGASGYPVTNAAWVFNPTLAGDYYIEFSAAASIKWFDITVATRSATPSAINGRVWSKAWAVRANNGFTTLADAFDTPFNGALFAYDGDYVTKIDFQGSGLRPLEGQFSFNSNGTANTGNKESDRRSVQDVNAGNPQYKIFLTPPDPIIYPVLTQGSLQNLPLKVANPSSPNITVEVTQPGKVEILLDFGGDGTFTTGVDRRLFANVNAGINTIPWDGKNGAGATIGLSSYPIPVKIAYTQGETHFTSYDVEGLDNGFDVYTQTASGTVGPNLQFWDDVSIPDAPGTAPVVKTNVDTGATTRQTWTNTNYGDLNTINTWWYAYRDYQTTTMIVPGDYGDAPASYGVAWHAVAPAPGGLYLGVVAPDLENLSQPSSNALLDDSTGTADEESIAMFPPLLTPSGQTYTVSVNVTNTTGSDAYLVGYIDFNKDGDFLDTGEKSATVTVNASGSQDVSFTTPAGMTTGTTYARFRLSSTQTQAESSIGAATSGEVEDYALPISPSIFGTIWNDSDASITLNGSESATNAGGLTVYAVNTSGNVAAKATVAADGTYVIGGLSAAAYTLRLSTDSSAAIGASAPTASLPTGWVNTGENKNGVTETTTPGEIAVTLSTSNITNQNFGIEQLPDTNAVTSATIPNSNGDTSLASTPLAGTDPDGSVASFKIVTIPPASEGVLKWDNDNNAATPPIAVSAGQTIPLASANKLFFDPAPTFIGDATFTYAAIDNGTKEDPSPATYTIPVILADIDLVITKTSNLSGPQVGDTVTYTVTVENLSTTNATGVVVTDTFPADLTFNETVGCAEDPNFLTGSSITCSLGTINAGTNTSFTVEGIVIDQGLPGDDDDSGRVISNSVSVTANETDSDTSNNTDDIDITVSKFQLYKEVRNVTAGGAFTTSVTGKPGDVLEYRINYTRTGPPIFDVILEDTLDANVSLGQNTYGASTDKEISLRCPDGTDVLLETGAVTTINIDLVAECTLNTATDATSTVREALLNSEAGYFLFKVRIR